MRFVDISKSECCHNVFFTVVDTILLAIGISADSGSSSGVDLLLVCTGIDLDIPIGCQLTPFDLCKVWHFYLHFLVSKLPKTWELRNPHVVSHRHLGSLVHHLYVICTSLVTFYLLKLKGIKSHYILSMGRAFMIYL